MEKDVTVKCIGCKQPWIISAEAFSKAQGTLINEFPEDSLVVIREDAFGFLCGKCHEEATRLGRLPGKPAKKRAPRRKSVPD